MSEPVAFRTLNYEDPDELLRYVQIFWDIPLEHDIWFVRRSEQYIREWAETARTTETEDDTFSGIALKGREIVGLHVLRKFEEWDRTGAHIANLWVHEDLRGSGIAAGLKKMGEEWARIIGADFINTNVNAANQRMKEINEGVGFEVYRYNMRKKL